MTDKAKLIEKIKQTDWYADWSGPFPLLEVSTANDIYFTAMQSHFGKSFSHFLVIFKEGIASAKLPDVEFQALGKYLAGKTEELSYAKKWASEFKVAADKIMPEIKVAPDEFLRKLSSLGKLYQDYGAYNVATKIVFNYLPKDAREVREILEEARKYSEPFYKDNSVMFIRLAEYLKDRTGYSKHLVLMMSRNELYAYQKMGKLPNKDELQERYSCSGVYFNRGRLHELAKREVEDIESSWLTNVTKEGLIGTIAYPGKVKGVCRIVADFKKANLKNGEILITGMTDPDFVPLMKKATGIVTDGGGLLSHAAIVARELKKPCIVGTKVATQVLKDGDLVEVDANKGIVKLIS